jgi:transketolase
MIKNDVAYSDHPVKLIGISAGVSYGALGSTHHSLHDLAALRAINNIEIVVPADNVETRQIIRSAATGSRPIYIRFGKAPQYHLHAADAPVELGKGIILREGSDLAVIATGETVVHALLASEALAARNISCRVISMHTIKPLDADIVLRAGRECGAIVTVEEHMVNGGLGEACAGLLARAGVGIRRFKTVGIPDEYTVTGSQADIFRHYGISMEGLTDAVLTLLK